MSIDLASLHTKVLLNALKSWRAHVSRNHDEFILEGRNSEFIDAAFFGLPSTTTSEVTLEQLKAELATREHVPNKLEARAIRQAKAKAARNR